MWELWFFEIEFGGRLILIGVLIKRNEDLNEVVGYWFSVCKYMFMDVKEVIVFV